MNRTTKLRYHLIDFINNRPLCFFSFMVGLKEIAFGLGFILALEEIRQTRVYQNYDALIPGYTGIIAGVVMVIIGLFISITAIADHIEVTRPALRASAFLWLFSAFMYALNGDVILALGIGLFMSAIPGYLAFYYKHAPLWQNQKRELREFFALDVEPAPVIEYSPKQTKELTNAQIQSRSAARNGIQGN